MLVKSDAKIDVKRGNPEKADERIQALIERSHTLAVENKRNVYVDNAEFLVYHWSGEAAAFSPNTGELSADEDKRINIGDHNARVDVGGPFPYAAQMPSKVNGFEYTSKNWAEDYAFFLDHSPAEVLNNERVVGEFHWMLEEARFFQYPEEQRELGRDARELGAGGISFTHTCPDLKIGLDLGWGGLQNKIQERREKFLEYGNTDSAEYMDASETVLKAIMRYIEKHAEKARELSLKEENLQNRNNYDFVEKNCRAIISDAPANFAEAVQWIQLFTTVERINGHGNGYGRLDQMLNDYYVKDIESGNISRDEAVSLVAELYLKYGGNYWSFAGRDINGKDATNEMSWVCMEAYDITGGYNHLGLMWHEDIDKDFYNYGCEVLARHNCGTPTLVNFDVLRDSQLRCGVKEEDAWNMAYSGCQWYCVVGKEYNDQDLNSFVLVQPMQRAMEIAAENLVDDFEKFWDIYNIEVDKTAEILKDFKNETYKWQAKVWPEMVTSFCMHGTLENGRDVTDMQAVNYNFTSVNVLGVPNVIDSIYAIKELVFKQKKYNMNDLINAVANDWKGSEIMQQDFLHQPKFGNAHEDIDAMAVRISEHIRETLESKRNIKGFNFRPSLFQYMGHTYAGELLGATPDGRNADEPLAHGMNPMHGRNTEGMAATMQSFCSLDYRKYQGGSFQVELQPSFFPTGSNKGDMVETFSKIFFEQGGVQINLNTVDLEKLKDAMEHPEKKEYRSLVVKVTGYSAHFIVLDRKFQEEFLQRVNYASL
jgi:choline trimethylamine-lyase